MKEYLKKISQEVSTYRGLIWLLSSFGVYTFSTDQADAMVAMAMALAGAGGLLPDRIRRLPGDKDV